MNEAEATKKQQQAFVRAKCSNFNDSLRDSPSKHADIVKSAQGFAEAIISNASLMQLLIGDEMSRRKPNMVLSPNQLPIPTTADVQEAILSAVDLGFRAALQHDVMKNDVDKMNYFHCRFAVPQASELIQQPTN